jgi:hypothetical protein
LATRSPAWRHPFGRDFDPHYLVIGLCVIAASALMLLIFQMAPAELMAFSLFCYLSTGTWGVSEVACVAFMPIVIYICRSFGGLRRDAGPVSGFIEFMHKPGPLLSQIPGHVVGRAGPR